MDIKKTIKKSVGKNVKKKVTKLTGNVVGKINLDKLKLDKILTDSFIKKNTKLDSVKAFIQNSGFDVKSILDFNKVPLKSLNAYVKKISSFKSWKDMLLKAVAGK